MSNDGKISSKKNNWDSLCINLGIIANNTRIDVNISRKPFWEDTCNEVGNGWAWEHEENARCVWSNVYWYEY